jgi:pimeloyl-ACP methyl ester carboxylesterase
VAEYVELRGIRTWYDVHRVGEPLLLVHPGGVGVDSRAFGPNVPQLSEAFRVYTPDRRGHGRTPDVDGPITYEAMAADTIEFIERIEVHRVYRRAVDVSDSVLFDGRRKWCRRSAACARDIEVGVRMPPSAPA